MTARLGVSLRWPGAMVSVYYRALDRQCDDAANCGDLEVIREHATVAIMLAVTMVETFLNAYCQQVGMRLQEPMQLAALSGRDPGLEPKLARWPTLFLGQPLDETGVAWRGFDALRQRRNALMHFRAGSVSVRLGPQAVPIVDMSSFDKLTAADAELARRQALRLMEALLLIGARGDRASARAQLAHLCAGVVVDDSATEETTT